MSYQSQDSAVLGVQLKVQEVCVTLADVEVVSISGLTATVKLGQPIKAIRAALHVDDSAGDVLPVAAADRAVSGNQVVLTLSAALAAADAIILKYEIQE